MSEMLTPKSNRWEMFTDALERAVESNGCDGDGNVDNYLDVYRQAKRIMADMGNVDIPASLTLIQIERNAANARIFNRRHNGEPQWEK